MATDIVKQGYVRSQSKNLGVWNKKWLMLRRQSVKGPLRLEKYKDEYTASIKSVYGADKKIIDLTRVDRAERLPESVKKHAITVIVNSSNLLQFCVNSEMEAESWLNAIREEMHPENRITHESFTVYMLPNDYIATSGDCTFQLERDSIRILERYGGRELITWPFNGLRRFGIEANMFYIEAGSSCPQGEGKFYFRCNDSEFIFQRVQSLSQAPHRTNGPATTQQSSFSESSWGNVYSLRELSERRPDRGGGGDPMEENAYRLDQTMPERTPTRRTGPLPPRPGDPTSAMGDQYSQVSQYSRGTNPNSDYSSSASLMNRIDNTRASSSQVEMERAGGPYYAVTRSRGTHETTPTTQQPTTAGNRLPSSSSSSPSFSGSSRSDSATSDQTVFQSVGGPYYSVSRREANEFTRQASTASGSNRERSQRTGNATGDGGLVGSTNVPMRSVRVDGTYYAVGRQN